MQIEVDDKLVGEWRRPGMHTQMDGQRENTTPTTSTGRTKAQNNGYWQQKGVGN